MYVWIRIKRSALVEPGATFFFTVVKGPLDHSRPRPRIAGYAGAVVTPLTVVQLPRSASLLNRRINAQCLNRLSARLQPNEAANAPLAVVGRCLSATFVRPGCIFTFHTSQRA